MSRHPLSSEDSLDTALHDLGAHVAYPPQPDLGPLVRARLEREPVRSSRPAFLRRAVLIPLAALLALFAGTIALSPQARSAVASWLHVAGIGVTTGGTLPGPLGHDLRLGQRLTISEAQQRVPFKILIPRIAGVGPPDEVYRGTPPASGRVSLLFHAGPELPRAATTGAGLLVTEFESNGLDFLAFKKLLPQGTVLDSASVGQDQVWYIGGAAHALYYIGKDGKPIKDSVRLAGNTLLWQHGSVTIRLEAQLPMRGLLRIAESMR